MAKESVGVVDGRNADLGLVGELSIPENGCGEYLDIDWRSPVFGRIISGVVLDSLPEKDIGIRLEVEEDSSGGFERTAWWEAGGGVAYWEGVGALTEEILGLNGGSGLLGWAQNKGLLRVHRSSPISFAGGQWMKPARDCIAGGDNQVRKRLSLGFSRFVWVGEDPRTGESPKKQTRAEVYFDLGPNGLSARSWFYVLDLRRTEFLRFAFSQLRGNFIKVEVLGTKKLPGHSMTNEAKRRRNEVRRIVGQGGETAADLFLSPLRTFEELMVSDGQVHLELRQETSTLIRGRPERIKLWGAELRARPFDLIFDQGPFEEFGQTR